TLVIEPLAIAVHHHAERHAVDAGTDAAIINRGARVDSHAMALRRIPDHVRSLVHHELEKHALIETGATDQEVLCRPLAPLILSPGLAKPFAIGLKAAGGENRRPCLDPFSGLG